MRAVLQVPVLASLLVTSAGCNYKSDYQPPNDGRARPIWDGDKVVIAMPPALPRCRHAIPGEPPPGYTHYYPRDREGYYLPPRRSSGGIVIVGVGVHHHGHVPGPPVPFLPGGNMGGEEAKAMLVVIAVGAMVAFPFVAMGLALGHPEPEDEVIEAIDKLNRYNDDARRIIALCYATLPNQGGPDGGGR